MFFYKHINTFNNNKNILLTILFFCLVVNIVNSQDSIYQKFYFESSNISSEGFLINNVPAGKWISYHENSQLKSIGYWKNSQLDSTWLFYDSTGNLILMENYLQNLKDGLSTEFDSEGFIKKETHYKKGKKDGKENIFFKNSGLIQFITTYDNGKKNGETFEYNKEQKIITILNYDRGVLSKKEEINRYDSDGNKQGIWKDFHDNGKIKKEVIFFHGKKDGFEKVYNKKGKIQELRSYNKGEEIGNEISLGVVYNKVILNNNNYLLGVLENDLKQGLFKEFNSNGELLSYRFYNNDTLIYKGNYDSLNNKTGKWIYYWENGSKKKEGFYSKNQKEREWKYFYRNGNIQQKGTYIKNLPNGLWEWWYENNTKRRTEEYLNGRENGIVEEYDTNGTIITRGEFAYGEREGEWYYIINDYKERGKYIGGMKIGKWEKTYLNKNQLKFVGEFINDTPIGKHIHYFSNGMIREVGKYKDGEKNGEWKKYNQKGDIVLTQLFKRGVEIKREGIKIKL